MKNIKCVPYIFFIALFIISSPAFSVTEEIDKPIGPIIYGNGNGGFEIFWFYPGLNKRSSGNIDFVPSRGVVSSMEDRQYCLFTGFSVEPPFCIEQASTYIMNSDMYPELAGDQYSPIRLAIKKRISENLFDDMWFAYINLDFGADFPGEKIESAAKIYGEDLFEIYHTLEWLPGTPTAPMIGVNNTPPYFNQSICPMDDSSYQLVHTSAQAMVGLDILQWNPARISSDGIDFLDDLSMSFDVIFGVDSANIFENGETIANVFSDSLRAEFSLPASGYISVKAKLDGMESYTDPLFCDTDRIPDLSVTQMQGNSIILKNNDDIPYDILIKYDTSSLIFPADNLILEAGAENTVDYEIKKYADSDQELYSPVIIKAEGEFYPIINFVNLSRISTGILDESDDNLPDVFQIGDPYPNPFNPSVNFKIMSSIGALIKIDIYNILGQNIYSQEISQGTGDIIQWDGVDNSGQEVATGLYFIHFSSGQATEIRKTVLIR